MFINAKASTLESLSLSRGLAFGNRAFHFDRGVNLSHCGILIIELWNCGCVHCLRAYSRRE